MGQVIHPRVPDTPPDDVPIDKKQKDYKQRAINLNSSSYMYSPNYTHSNHRDNFIPGIDDYDTSSNHILTQNPNQTNVTSSHGSNCGHTKLKILILNCMW